MNSTTPEATSESLLKRGRKSTGQLSQLDLFSDDVMGAITVLEIADGAQAAVTVAVDANPSILPPADEQPDARGNLDYAHFMRLAGVSEVEVEMSLQQVGADPVVVMAQLAQVEAEVGNEYPNELLDELVGDDAVSDEVDTVDSESGDVEPSDVDPVEAAVKSANDESSVSALSALMKRIRGPRFQPLSVEEETLLAARIRAGEDEVNASQAIVDALLNVGPQVPAAMQSAVARRARAEVAFSAVRNELADHNMRFLVVMAKRFRYTGRPLDELISAGTIGLIAAAKKFDPTRGRFTTCAQHWIRQSIQRSLLTDSLMKTPAYMPAKESKLRKGAEFAATPEERAKMLEQADNLKREITARRATHVSLDAGSDDDSDGGGLHNMFAADSADIEDTLEHSRLVEWLVQAANRELKTMDGKPDVRARDIFLLRLGLHRDHYGDPQALAEVSVLFDVSRERVRQIYNEAALEVVTAVEHYAKGAHNLPSGFRDGLLNLGRRAVPAEPKDEADAAMQAIFAAEAAGPDETQKRAQLVGWLVKAASRELKNEDGKADNLARDVFLMRIGLHGAHYGEPQSVAQVGRRLCIPREEVRRLYDAAAEEIAYAVEHYAQNPQNLPSGFRRSLMSPGR